MIKKYLQLCTEGCLQCDGNDNCLICDSTSLYVLVNGTCEQQNLEFCYLSFEINTCSLCMEGYYLEVNNKCVSNPTGINVIKNCHYYETYHKCQKCDSYYYLSKDRRECLKIKTKITHCADYDSEDTCLYCSYGQLNMQRNACEDLEDEIESCMFLYETYYCEECQQNYLLNKNFYMKSSLIFQQFIFSKYQYPLTLKNTLDISVCQKIEQIENCLIIDEISFTCIECKEGYYVEQKNKKQCLENPYQIQQYDIVKIPYCQTINSEIQIINNIKTTVYFCELCYEGYYLTANYKKCNKHTQVIPNCKVMSQEIPNECIQCMEKYYRDNKEGSNDKCHLRLDTRKCKTPDPLSLQCKECEEPDYVKHYQNRYCSPPIARCNEYIQTEEVLSCKYCEKNYFYNQNNQICQLNAGINYDPFCSLYDSNRKCVKCLFGFFYNSLTSRCIANDLEFQHFSDCNEYSFDKKNICIDCVNEKTLIQVNVTCKLPPDNPSIFNSMTNYEKCLQFEMDSNLAIKCVTPNNPIQDDTCQMNPSDPACHTYYINTLTWKPEKNVEDNHCKHYNDYWFSQTNPNECSICWPTYTGEKDFSAQNLCVSSISFCSSQQRYAENNQCIKPFDNCGRVIFQVSDGNSVQNFDVNSCQGQYNANDCKQISTISNDDGVQENMCAIFKDVDTAAQGVCPGGTFYRTVTNDIIKTDTNICVEFRTYPNDLCLKEQDGVCLVCKSGYYPDIYKEYFFEKEFIEPYQSHVSEPGMTNCIIYDSKKQNCRQCIKGYRLSIENQYCQQCSGQGKTGNSSDLFCRNFDFINKDDNGLCDRTVRITDNIGASTDYCVACQEGYIPQYDIRLDTTFELYTYWINTLLEETFIRKPIQQYETQFCKLKDANIFYKKQSNQESYKYCEWGYGSNAVFFCLSCIFGYYGDRDVSIVNTYIEGCVKNTLCDNTKQIFIKEPEIRNLASCHYCLEDGNIPTLLSYFFKFESSNENYTWIYKGIEDGVTKDILCYQKPFYIDDNCLIQVYIFDDPQTGKAPLDIVRGIYQSDPTISSKFTNEGISLTNVTELLACTTCKPMYKPTYQLIKDSFFTYYPKQITTTCVQIDNCSSSKITNICEECDLNYVLSDDKTECIPVATKLYTVHNIDQASQATFNAQYLNDNQFRYCAKVDALSATPDCEICKTQYVKTNYCIEYQVDGCKYYDQDNCIESKAKMGTQYNILYIKDDVFEIKQSSCKEILTAIPFCKVYNKNQKCMVCKDGYRLNNSQTICDNFTIDHCIEYDLTVDVPSCKKCGYVTNTDDQGVVTYTIYKISKQSLSLNETITISTYICIEDLSNKHIPGCKIQNEGLCIECEQEGYYPVIINNNQDSICIDIRISNLCEEYDIDEFLNNQIISCKKCKKISQIKTEVQNNNYDLSDYDLVQFDQPDLIIDLEDAASNLTELRATLFQKTNEEWCRSYIGIDNCVQHDDTSLDRTFDCQQCNNSQFYLQQNKCFARSLMAVENLNCKTFYDTQDKCLAKVGDSGYAITLSSFDKQVIENPPKVYNSQLIQITEIENCLVYQNENVCEICKQGYYLYDNLCLQVTQKIPDCKIYDSDGVCKKCLNEYLLFQNKCLNVYAQNCQGFLTNTKCLQCPVQYPIQNVYGNCLKNEQIPYCKIYDSLESCLECENNFQNNKGICEPLRNADISNCKIQIDGGICSQCVDGYTLAVNQKSCVPNPVYDRNCKQFQKDIKCSICEVGYYFKGDLCFPCDTDQLSCMMCDPLEPSRCIICNVGFFMNNNLDCIISPSYVNHKIRVSDQSIVNIEEIEGLLGHNSNTLIVKITLFILYIITNQQKILIEFLKIQINKNQFTIK